MGVLVRCGSVPRVGVGPMGELGPSIATAYLVSFTILMASV